MTDALAIRDDAAVWQVMQQRASILLKSGFLPKAIRTPEQAIAIMQTGRELGLGDMQSLRSIHVIDGKPSLSAELMAALVFRHVPGATLRVAITDNEECEVHAARPGNDYTKFRFTMDDAKTAGLAGKSNWRTYPRSMLRSRAVSEACRAIFPDAIMGLYTPEELGAAVDAEGAVVTDLAPVRLVTAESTVEAEAELFDSLPPQAALPAKPAVVDEPWRFASGKHAGEPITEVPTAYLQQLGKTHAVNARLRSRVDAELRRRDQDPDYIAERLRKSLDAVGDFPESWKGSDPASKGESSCPECEGFVADCALCNGTGKPTGIAP